MAEFNPYQQHVVTPNSKPLEKLGTPELPDFNPLLQSGQSHHDQSRDQNRSPPNLYWRISHWFGFREKYSLALFFVCGGALLGFCLSSLVMFNPSNVQHKSTPGEWFWYRQKLYKANIFIHIFTTVFGGILSGWQFVPTLRERNRILVHKVNGYIVTVLLVIGMVTGGIVARRSLGGELNIQSAFFVSGIMVTYSVLAGIVHVKDTLTHRKWMLRAIAYLGSLVTARIIRLCAVEIISNIGTFYSIWKCEEIEFTLGKSSKDFMLQFPQCTSPDVQTIVRASTTAGRLSKGSAVRCTFGMTLWIGLLIHAIAVEVYICLTEETEKASYKRDQHRERPQIRQLE